MHNVIGGPTSGCGYAGPTGRRYATTGQFPDTSGCARTLLDTFGHFWTRADASGHVRTLLDTSGHFWIGADTSGHDRTRLDTSGHFLVLLDRYRDQIWFHSFIVLFASFIRFGGNFVRLPE